jgi:hypothetical protein
MLLMTWLLPRHSAENAMPTDWDADVSAEAGSSCQGESTSQSAELPPPQVGCNPSFCPILLFVFGRQIFAGPRNMQKSNSS